MPHLNKAKVFSKFLIFNLMFDYKVLGGKILKLQQLTYHLNHVAWFNIELDCDWIWIGLSIHFETWNVIWIGLSKIGSSNILLIVLEL